MKGIELEGRKAILPNAKLCGGYTTYSDSHIDVNLELSQRLDFITQIKILEEAVAKGHKFEFPVYWGVDLASEHERFLVEEHFKRPVILTDYPKEIKQPACASSSAATELSTPPLIATAARRAPVACSIAFSLPRAVPARQKRRPRAAALRISLKPSTA